MNNNIINQKKLAIIAGIVIGILLVVWVVVSILESSNLIVKRVYDIRRDYPSFMVCFNKAVKNESSTIKSQDFDFKSIRSHDDTCLAFSITPKEGDILTEGEYRAILSAESESGQKISDENIDVNIVNGPNQHTLSNSEVNDLVNANNSAGIHEWMNYWMEQPIYEFVDSKSFVYSGAMWSIGLRADDDNNPIIIIYIHMPQPPNNRPALKQSSEQYKKAALNKISEWGFNPEDYTIQYKFNN